MSAALGRPRLALPLSTSFNPWEDSHLLDMILYIGNLSPETSYTVLYHYLLDFDEVVWLKIQFDRSTAAPKGYAHAILKTSLGYHKILTTAVHLLRGSKLRIKMGRKSMCFATVEEEVNRRKVFVKRLPKNMTIERLRSHFGAFGAVVDVDIPVNHVDKTSRRIGFVTFESEETAAKCAEIKKHLIKGAEIICKRYLRPEDKAPGAGAQVGSACLRTGQGPGSGSTAPLEKSSELAGEGDLRGDLTQEDIETRYPAIHPKHLVYLQAHFPFHGAGLNQSTFGPLPAPEPFAPTQLPASRQPRPTKASLHPSGAGLSQAGEQQMLWSKVPTAEQRYKLSQGSLTSAGFGALLGFGDVNKRMGATAKKQTHRTGTAIVFFKDFGLKMVSHVSYPEV